MICFSALSSEQYLLHGMMLDKKPKHVRDWATVQTVLAQSYWQRIISPKSSAADYRPEKNSTH